MAAPMSASTVPTLLPPDSPAIAAVLPISLRTFFAARTRRESVSTRV